MALLNCSSRCGKPFAPASSSAKRTMRSVVRVECGQQERSWSQHTTIGGGMAAGLAAAALCLTAQPALAKFRLPPLDSDPNRCERAYTGNTIGQANAVSDKVLDLRQCKYHGKNLSTKVLSGALISDADFSDSTLKETVLTKAYAVGADFSGANLTNAVIDRVDFTKANMKGAKFNNAIITGSVFTDAELSDTSFEEALIGGEDVKRICLNPTLTGESRIEVGCRK